ncbi:hypothetical protein DVH24_033275 [Malus domestica]|uniref:Beta-amylase n=1 Tax=Malus domestica TaxID=3750 RepID=A0A498J9C2_MALDO|nr:hypothetical protein DVH24_033275 [Malus domestica]
MKERSREMGSSPPTVKEIFRDYCASRTDALWKICYCLRKLKITVFKFWVLLRLHSPVQLVKELPVIISADVLHPVLTEYRVTKSDLELALIQFANDLSSEAHVEVMRKVRVGMYEYQLESMFLHHMRRIIVQLYMDLLLLDCAALKFWIGAISEDAPCPRNHRHQQLWLRSSSSSSIPSKFHYLSLLSPTHCVSILPGKISEIEVGLGPCRELRYPYPEQHGWKYPVNSPSFICGYDLKPVAHLIFYFYLNFEVSLIQPGLVQCYDRYLMKNLTQAAKARGHSFWASVPDNASSYNSQPHEIGFFRDGGDYDSYYCRFFLN